MRYLLLIAVLFFTSCSSTVGNHPTAPVMGPPGAPVRTQAPTTAAEADKLIKLKDAEIDKLNQELNTAQGDRKLLVTERDQHAAEEETARVRKFALWVSWLAGFGFFASIVAGVLLASTVPWAGKLGIGGAGASVALLAMARVLAWLAPYLFAVGLGITALGVIILIVWLRKSGKVNKAVVSLYEKVKPTVDSAIGTAARQAMQAETVASHSSWIDHIRSKMGLIP